MKLQLLEISNLLPKEKGTPIYVNIFTEDTKSIRVECGYVWSSPCGSSGGVDRLYYTLLKSDIIQNKRNYKLDKILTRDKII
jgi:hypothetical protein